MCSMTRRTLRDVDTHCCIICFLGDRLRMLIIVGKSSQHRLHWWNTWKEASAWRSGGLRAIGLVVVDIAIPGGVVGVVLMDADVIFVAGIVTVDVSGSEDDGLSEAVESG